MTALALQNTSVILGNRVVIDDVSLAVAHGECVGLIGPNGAGKSTLMRAALGLIPAEGRSSLSALTRSDRAQTVAWLPQNREIAWDLTVEALVALGRTPHRRLGAPLTETDQTAIANALSRTEMAPFANRAATQLSGGEQARVLLARALAQETPLLLADEPIAALDPSHQIATMETFARLAQQGRTVVVALHDLGLAARWCSRLLLMDQGRVVADGAPEDVLTPQQLAETYGVAVHLERTANGLIVQATARLGS